MALAEPEVRRSVLAEPEVRRSVLAVAQAPVARLAEVAARVGLKPAAARLDLPMRGLEAPEPGVRAVWAWAAPARVVPRVGAEPKPAVAGRQAAPAVQSLLRDRLGVATVEPQAAPVVEWPVIPEEAAAQGRRAGLPRRATQARRVAPAASGAPQDTTQPSGGCSSPSGFASLATGPDAREHSHLNHAMSAERN